MPVFARISGEEIEVDAGGHSITSLRSLCDTRKMHDTRSPLTPGTVAGLRFQWIVALELQSAYRLSLSQIASVMRENKGRVSRMLERTRELLERELVIELTES
jgi:hypothetical protein